MQRTILYDLIRITRTPNGTGGFVIKRTTIKQVRGTVALKTLTFQTRIAGDQFVGGQLQTRVFHLCSFHTGDGIQKSDRIVSRASSAEIFTVQSIRIPGDRGKIVELQLVEIQKGN